MIWYEIIFNDKQITIIDIREIKERFCYDSSNNVYMLQDYDGLNRVLGYHQVFNLNEKGKIHDLLSLDTNNILINFLQSIRAKKLERIKNNI